MSYVGLDKVKFVRKRQTREYYEDYSANDLREKGMYGQGKLEEGLSRNRNKDFEAINKKLQQPAQAPHQLMAQSKQPVPLAVKPHSRELAVVKLRYLL